MSCNLRDDWCTCKLCTENNFTYTGRPPQNELPNECLKCHYYRKQERWYLESIQTQIINNMNKLHTSLKHAINYKQKEAIQSQINKCERNYKNNILASFDSNFGLCTYHRLKPINNVGKLSEK